MKSKRLLREEAELRDAEQFSADLRAAGASPVEPVSAEQAMVDYLVQRLGPGHPITEAARQVVYGTLMELDLTQARDADLLRSAYETFRTFAGDPDAATDLLVRNLADEMGRLPGGPLAFHQAITRTIASEAWKTDPTGSGR